MTKDITISDKQLEKEAIELLEAIIPLFAEKWLDPGKLMALCERFTGASKLSPEEGIAQKILFFTGLLNDIIKPLPLRFYQDDSQRTHMIETIQQIIDELVLQEEEMVIYEDVNNSDET